PLYYPHSFPTRRSSDLQMGDTLALVAGGARYGLLFLLPFTVLELAWTEPGAISMRDVLLLLYLGAGCSVAAFLLSGYGLSRMDADRKSTRLNSSHVSIS